MTPVELFKTSTAATGTCVIVAGKSSHLLIRAGGPNKMWWLTCNDNTCTSGRCTSFKYSWWWVLAPETCRVTLQKKNLHSVATSWCFIWLNLTVNIMYWMTWLCEMSHCTQTVETSIFIHPKNSGYDYFTTGTALSQVTEVWWSSVTGTKESHYLLNLFIVNLQYISANTTI